MNEQSEINSSAPENAPAQGNALAQDSPEAGANPQTNAPAGSIQHGTVVAKEPLWTRNFIIITIINFFIFSGFQMFPASLGPYLKSIGTEDSALGWIIGISMLATLIVRPFAGAALDRFGRKWVFILGIVVVGVASAAHLIQVISIICIVRFIHGLGFGTANTASNTVATDNMPKTRFAEGMGFFSLSSSLALAIAPAIALSLGSSTMIYSATVCMLIAALAAFSIHYKAPEKKPDGSRKFSDCFEKSAMLPAFILFCITTTYGAVTTFLALSSQEQGIENIGIYFTVYALVLLVTRPSIGKFLDRRGFGAAILPGLLFVTASLVVLSYATTIPMFILSAVLFGIGQGSVQNSAQTMAVVYAPKHRVGIANATYFMGFDAGVGVGSIVAGSLVSVMGYSNMYLLNALFPLLGIAIYFYASYKNKKSM